MSLFPVGIFIKTRFTAKLAVIPSIGIMVVPISIIILVVSLYAVHIEANMKDKFQMKPDAPEVEKCMKFSGFKLEGPPPESPTSEQLCFLKCLMEEKGFIKEDGKVDPDIIDNIPMAEDKKNDAKQCLANAGNIKTCEDVAQLITCAPM